MCDNGFQWAAAHGKLRINNVHKEEEACLILSESFELLDETGQEITLEGGFEVEEAWINVGFWLLAHVYDIHTYACITKDDSGFLLTGELPDINAAADAVVAGPSSSTGASVGEGHQPAMESSSSFRILLHEPIA